MSQVYPVGPKLVEEPWITYYGFDEPKVAWLYYYWIATAVYCCTYIAFSRFIAAGRRRWYRVVDDAAVEVSKFKGGEHAVQLGENAKRIVQPLYFGPFGRFGYGLLLMVSLLFPLLFILLLTDYYWMCEIKGIDALCFFGSYPVFGGYTPSSKVLFFLWVTSAVWFSFWLTFQNKLINQFRVGCAAEHATHVYVKQLELHPEVLTADPSIPVKVFRFFKVKIAHISGTKNQLRFVEATHKIEKTSHGTIYFIHQGTRHFYNAKLGVYEPIAPFKVHTYGELYKNVEGLTQEAAEEMLDGVGPNIIPFKVDPLVKMLVDEFFTFFYLYQWIMYTVWFWFSYIFVAAMLVSIVFAAAALNIYTNYRNQAAIAKVAYYDTEVEVLRRFKKEGTTDQYESRWAKVSCLSIVPGDVMRMKEGWKLPCDMMLVQGACVCDESSLTGEAHPVQKIEAPNDINAKVTEKGAQRFTLYSGTTLLQVERGQHDDALAVVTATGIQTGKGQLISHILYPQRILFKYDEELPVVAAVLIVYALIVFPIAIWFQIKAGTESSWITKWVYGLFTVSQIFNPILPVTLTVGQIKSSIRLGFRRIFTLNPARIAVSGKIRLFCFDKTGTLTRPGLDFLKFEPARENAGAEAHKMAEWGMATAHAITMFKDQYIGNQVEVRMFEACGWTLIQRGGQPPVVEAPTGGVKLDVVKRFEFDHTRMTMSVLVRGPDGQHYVFIKGSFEAIAAVSDPHTVPGSYVETGRAFSLDGVYVLGVGFKKVDFDPSKTALEDVMRDDIEAKGSITMLGYLLFRNELKDDTPAAIRELREGMVRPVMVTGDNAQTGFFIAKSCGMVDKGVTIILAQADASGNVAWKPMAGANEVQPTETYSTKEIMGMVEEMRSGAVELAVNGKAFGLLMEQGFYDEHLFYFRIFARVTPEEKVLVVKMFRDRGLIVGMCGDGGNDCGALRIAHAGVALSDAEASLVSPFTSQDKSVLSVVELLKEGRCALHTSFGAYKFIIMYGQLFALLKLCSFWYGVILCQMDYVMFDGIAVITMPIAISMALPLSRLNEYRPTSSLFSPTTVAAIVGLMVISLIFLVAALIHGTNHPDYIAWPSKLAAAGASWWLLGDNWESTLIYFAQFFSFLGAGLVFAFGSKFRQPFFKNYVFVVVFLSLYILNTLLLLLPESDFTRPWHVASQAFNSKGTNSVVWQLWQEDGNDTSPGMSFRLRLELWILAQASIVAMVLYQRLFVEGYFTSHIASWNPSKRPVFRV